MLPNIVFIMSDQQRWDTLGCLGQSHMITPHIDALAKRGVCFSHTFVQSTICAPARASLVSGKYVHRHGADGNGTWLREGESNWIERLREAGYHTANIGKMHTAPIRLPCGFDHRLVVENKNYQPTASDGPDDYDLFLQERGLSRPANLYPEMFEDWWDELQTAVWPLDEDLYPDNFIGNRTVDYIRNHDYKRQALFMWAGFIGPHDPFDAPASALERYADIAVPDPVTKPGELDEKPPQHRAGMEKMDNMRTQAAWCWSRVTAEKMRRMRKHYYANCTVIDDWVGRIVETIDALGQLDNTIFVYTSDHGDCLGDHHMIYKFSTHYESVVRVPLVMAGPGIEDVAGIRDPLLELHDLGPTLLELAGLKPDDGLDARSFRTLLQGEQDEFRDAVFSERGIRVMIRTREWKLVTYAGSPHGELYNLHLDPDELHNLWDDDRHFPARARLTERLLHWYVETRFINERC